MIQKLIYTLFFITATVIASAQQPLIYSGTIIIDTGQTVSSAIVIKDTQTDIVLLDKLGQKQIFENVNVSEPDSQELQDINFMVGKTSVLLTVKFIGNKITGEFYCNSGGILSEGYISLELLE